MGVGTAPFTALDAAGAQVVGAVLAVVRVAGPANYASGGIAVDVSATFSRILTVTPCRQFVTVGGGIPAANIWAHMTIVEAGANTFANGKFMLVLGRQSFTPAGTNAAPVASAVCIVGCNQDHPGLAAVAFTGTAQRQGDSEVDNGSALPNGQTFEVLVLGVPK